jgi:hypothetical protein
LKDGRSFRSLTSKGRHGRSIFDLKLLSFGRQLLSDLSGVLSEKGVECFRFAPPPRESVSVEPSEAMPGRLHHVYPLSGS